MPTVNAELFDRTVRHAIALRRFEDAELRKLLRFLNSKVMPDLRERLAGRVARIRSRGYDSGFDTTQRYRDLIAAVRDVIRAGTGRAYEQFRDSMVGLAKVEASWQAKTLGAAVPDAIGIQFVAPSAATLRSIVVSRPMQGPLLRDWFGSLADSTARRVETEVHAGLAQGEGVDAIVRRVFGRVRQPTGAGPMQATRRQLEMIVRTAANHVSTHARAATLAENEDVVREVEWVSTLDPRTCRVCAALDGQTFPLDEGPRPPEHPNCRCTIVPVLKGWRELGVRASRLPAQTRASMDGEVPEKQTFATWLKRQPKDVVDEVLGVRGGRAFRAGELRVSDFVDGQYRPLTLEELELA